MRSFGPKSASRLVASEKGANSMDVARCVRVFSTPMNDDLVTKRSAAIDSLASEYAKLREISRILAISSDLLAVFDRESSISEQLAEQVEAAIKEQSVSFVRDGCNLEVAVCALAAAVKLVEDGTRARSGWRVSDVLAVALWSGASYVSACERPKLEELRDYAIKVARNQVLRIGLEARKRRKVPQFSSFPEEEDFEATRDAFKKATSAIDALTNNAALDREEIDLLWWAVGGVSETLGKPFPSLPLPVRTVVAGVELGSMMRRLPTQSHRNLAFRGVEDSQTLSLPSLLNALGESRSIIADSVSQEPLIEDAPRIFPLLWALRHNKSSDSAGGRQRSLVEWGSRALLERATLRINYKGLQRI